MKAHHVVLAVERKLNDASRQFVHLRPTAHQLRAALAWGEVHECRALRETLRLVAIVATVALEEGRDDTPVDKHLFADERCEVVEHGRHRLRLARRRRALKQSGGGNRSLRINSHVVVCLAEHLAPARVCNGKHRRHGEQYSVATVRADGVLCVGIALLRAVFCRVH